jgi:very-short-patch-repair endonuclease
MSKRINVGETLMAQHLTELGLRFSQQQQVIHTRRWAWDFLLEDYRILIEVDGYFAGRHKGWGGDNEKQNAAVMQGWRPLRFSTNDVKRGKAKEFLKQWLSK